ncbi:MAG: fibrobacter succinogenes major paralogous domain-containing protein [Bacteroidales bacterium]|nr:fibrobacter succinogenes major paralogous domain-containing protein [Bacteroidales bacterium]
MKRIISIISFLVISGAALFSQNTFTFQAIMRDSANQLIRNEYIGVRISIIPDNPQMPCSYTEQHHTKTNDKGLLTILVGSGGYSHVGNFDFLQWGNTTYYIKTEIDPKGGTNYVLSSTDKVNQFPYSEFSHNSVTSENIEYNNIANLPHLFCGDYDSLKNKPNLFNGDYDSLKNKPVLFNGDYNNLLHRPSITDTLLQILADSNYLTQVTEKQTLTLHNDTIFLSGSNFVILPPTQADDYTKLTNTPNIKDTLRSILADSNYLHSFSESQALSIIGDTIYLTDGGSVVLPDQTDLSLLLDSRNTNQSVAGKKVFTDTILVPSRYDFSTKQVMGDNMQAATYAEYTHIIDSLQAELALLQVAAKYPVVVTRSVSNNSFPYTTATGEILSEKDATVTTRGICFALHKTPTVADTKVTNGSGIGSYNCSLYTYVPDTTYYIRAYAVNAFGTTYGNEISFRTPRIPTVALDSVYNVNYFNFESQSHIISDGGNAIYQKGVCCAIYPTIPEHYNYNTYDGSGTASYTSYYDGLQAGKKYIIRAYAINNVGVGYSDTMVFTTRPLSTPTVITNPMKSIAGTMAVASGNVTDYGGATVTARGFCWSTSNTAPTISDNYLTYSSAGTGAYTLSITTLTNNTTYYIRAYATNSQGTGYGAVISFQTTNEVNGGSCFPATVTDTNGNVYSTIRFGTQCWMRENLRATSYADGTPITVTSSSTSSTTPYAYYPGNSSSNVATYGYLYNWPAATRGTTSSNNPSTVQGICPNGWHLPSSSEYSTLNTFISNNSNYTYKDTVWTYYNYDQINECWYGHCLDDECWDWVCYTVDDVSFDYTYDGSTYTYVGPGLGEYCKTTEYYITTRGIAKALAASGVWTSSSSVDCPGNEDTKLNNLSNFSLYPSGYAQYGYSYALGQYAYLWVSNNYNSNYGARVYIDYSSTSQSIGSYTNFYKHYGCSVRCVKNE